MGSAHINVKERRVKKRKGTEVQMVKKPTPSGPNDALIEDEEQNGKGRRIQRKQQGWGPQRNYPRPFGHLLRHSLRPQKKIHTRNTKM